jgi:hypothetical protein
VSSAPFDLDKNIFEQQATSKEMKAKMQIQK